MDRAQLLSQLRRILVDDLFVGMPSEEIKETHELGSDLGLDSIGFTELATIVGDLFKVEAGDKEIGEGHFATLKTLCDFILGQAQKQGQAAQV